MLTVTESKFGKEGLGEGALIEIFTSGGILKYERTCISIFLERSAGAALAWLADGVDGAD
jgi:hypothetical protein